VISDTLDHVNLVILPFVSILTRLFGPDFFTLNKNEKRLTITETGAQLRWFTAENPQSPQGSTFTRVYIDESQNVADELFFNLRPALGARMAKVFAFGTPDPLQDSTWFEGMFLKGQDENESEYYSYSIPCWLNRWLPAQDIADAASGGITEAEFRMKYLGQWVHREGTMFANAKDCFTGQYEDWKAGGDYIIGLDLARAEDFTVAYVFETKQRKLVAQYRINHLPYGDVSDRVAQIYSDYHARFIRFDNTGVGDAVYEMLQARGLALRPFVFGLKSKERLVSVLAREIERKRIILPKEDKGLLRELTAFKRNVTKAGNVTYSAPVNFNDDRVMALGLCTLDLSKGGTVSVSKYAFGSSPSPFVKGAR
jgi:hypothetical protein